MNSQHIVVDNIVVDIVKKDIKNLHLRVLPPKGAVRITTPLRVSDKIIRRFVTSKLAWIRKRQLILELMDCNTPVEFVSGETHPYQGRHYPLNVVFQNGRPKAELASDGNINLYVRIGSDRVQREKVLYDWYRSQLQDQIPGLLQKWQGIIGVELASWSIKRMKTRWGSCVVHSARICFNLELAKKSPACLEFIVVHELTHLLERKHNARFKSLMDGFMPAWREHERELNSSYLIALGKQGE